MKKSALFISLLATLFLSLLATRTAVAQSPTDNLDTYSVPVTVGSTTITLVITIGEDGVPIVSSTTPNVAVGEPVLLPSAGESIAATSSRTALYTQAIVRSTANLRAGPATTQTVIGSARAGDALAIIGVSADGLWYALDNGAWISASLVQNAPARNTLTVITAPPSGSGQPAQAAAAPATTTRTVTVSAVPVSAAPAVSSGNGPLAVVGLNKIEEYAVIKNASSEAVNLQGWVLRSERGMQDCALGGTIEAGASLVISAMGQQAGFDCGFEKNIWNNSEPDAAVLLAPDGAEVSRLE